MDEIPINELTMTLVSTVYPRKVIEHLRTEKGYAINNVEDGIYYVEGDHIPIQIIVTSKLTEEENLWLKNLTNEIKEPVSARKLVDEYGKHKEDKLYQSIMNIIVRANKERFQEVKVMCEALEELMKDEMEALRRISIEQGLEEGRKQGLEQGLAQGLKQDIKNIIEICREFNLSLNKTADKIRVKYELSLEETEEYMKNNW